MKKNGITTFFIIIIAQINITFAQDINFNRYASITDANFKRFVALFEQRSLPLKADEIITQMNIWDLKKPALSAASVNSYLRKENGNVIPGALYYNEPADGLPAKPVEGVFYPLYKLPTNGNYVLLVFAQVDENKTSECAGKVFTLSYDLQGNYIYFSNYTYEPRSEYTGGLIDENLRSHHYYFIHKVNGEVVFPSREAAFSATEVHMSYQINEDGRSTWMSKEEGTAQFRYFSNECRFKKVN